MKNITVSVEDEIYHQARVAAAQKGTSVSALVREFLACLREGQPLRAREEKAEAASRKKLVQLLRECQIDLTERPTRDATYAHRSCR